MGEIPRAAPGVGRPRRRRRLAAARRTRDALDPDAAVIPHADRVHYVAGTSPRTVTDVEIVDGRVVLSVTTEGDGRVTYQSGRLPGVPMWYMDAAHGDLASTRAGPSRDQGTARDGHDLAAVRPSRPARPGAVRSTTGHCPSRCSIRRRSPWRRASSVSQPRRPYRPRRADESARVGGARRPAIRALSNRGRALRR